MNQPDEEHTNMPMTLHPKPITATAAPSAHPPVDTPAGGNPFKGKESNKMMNKNVIVKTYTDVNGNKYSYVKKPNYKSYPILLGLKCDMVEVSFFTTFPEASAPLTKVLNALKAADTTKLMKFTPKERKCGVHVIWGFAGQHHMMTVVVKAHMKPIKEEFCAAQQAVMVKSVTQSAVDAKVEQNAAALFNQPGNKKICGTTKATITFSFSPAVLDSFSLDGKEHENILFNAVDNILGWPEVLDECPLLGRDDAAIDFYAEAKKLIIYQPNIRTAKKKPEHNSTSFGAGKSKNILKMYNKTHAMLDKFSMDLKGPIMARVEILRRHRPPVLASTLHQLPNPLADVLVFDLEKTRAILAASPNPYQQSLAKAVDWENAPYEFTLKLRAIMDKYQKKLLWKALEPARHPNWNVGSINYQQQMLGALKANKVSRRMLGLDKLPNPQNPA
jgi:hypothetical protein